MAGGMVAGISAKWESIPAAARVPLCRDKARERHFGYRVARP
jgi:hypothetical protein